MTRPPLQRRRIYLMRHGSVDHFLPDGTPVRPERVALSAQGRMESDAAGTLFAACGVRFDRVLTSGLPRAVQTAQRVLRACGAALSIEDDPALEEIRRGRLADLAPDEVELAFLGAFRPTFDVEAQRFVGGESVGELLDRVLPAFDAWLARDDWQCLLLVLHGAVNRALLSTALVGGRAFFGRIEQQPACINVIDVGAGVGLHGDAVVRAINLTPTQWLHERSRPTTMEELLGQVRRAAIGAVAPAIPR